MLEFKGCKPNVTDYRKCYRHVGLAYLSHGVVVLCVPLQLCSAGTASVVPADLVADVTSHSFGNEMCTHDDSTQGPAIS